MVKTMRAGKNVLTSHGKLSLNAFHKLMRQKERIDQEMAKIMARSIRFANKIKAGKEDIRKIYVKRIPNKFTLEEAVVQSMIPNQETKFKDIIKKIKKNHLYATKSKYFYVAVNNVLNRDNSPIQRCARGVYKYVSENGDSSEQPIRKKRGRPRKVQTSTDAPTEKVKKSKEKSEESSAA